jgi:hypothetical protein
MRNTHQKLFPFIIARPYSLLPLPIPLHYMQETPLLLCDLHVVKLHHSILRPLNWYIIKLPMFSALIQHDIKLQDCPDYR